MAIYENNDFKHLNDPKFIKRSKEETLAKKQRLEIKKQKELRELEEQFSIPSHSEDEYEEYQIDPPILIDTPETLDDDESC